MIAKPKVEVKWKRDGREGHYVSTDGKWRLWKEPYHPRWWYLNEVFGKNDEADALVPEGSPTKWEATRELEKELEHRAKEDANPEMCEECDGSGIDPSWEEGDEEGTMDCPDCGGSGEVEARMAVLTSKKAADMAERLHPKDEAQKYTPTEERILAVLRDGLPHAKRELHDCLYDEASDKGALRAAVCRLRAKLKRKGETIVCVAMDHTQKYQHVRLLYPTSAG